MAIFDQVCRGQRSFFCKIDNFLALHYDSLKTINRSDIKLSPARFPFNSEPSMVSLLFIDGVFVTHRITEVNSVTPIGKSPEGKLGQWPWLKSGSVEGTINMSMRKISHVVGLRISGNPKNRQISHCRYVQGQPRSVTSETFERSRCNFRSQMWSWADLNHAYLHSC